MDRTVPAAYAVAIVVVACGGGLTAEEAQPLSSPSSSAQAADDGAAEREGGTSTSTKEATELDLTKLRLREGTRLRDASGRFRLSGDSLTFIDGESREISGLPNLNLERIIRMLKTVEEPESITWSVSGTVTEFSGRNYLLISRAVYKAASPPPAPESLAK
jgi:hypothetical protein